MRVFCKCSLLWHKVKRETTVTLYWELGTLGTSAFRLFILFVFFLLLLLLFFLSGFSFTDTDDSQDNRGRDRNIQTFILQLCVWDYYHTFLIAPLVFTRLLLDTDCYRLPPYRITIWLIDDAMLIFVSLFVDSIQGFCCSYLTLETGGLELSSLSYLYYKQTD